MAEDLHQRAAERLGASGLRYNRNRRLLVAALAASDRPVTIAELLAAEPALAQSSAYRNLVDLDASGVVHRVTSTDEFARYELAEDLTDHHHHHLICSTCGEVADFTVSAQLERTLEAAMAGVARRTGFRPEHHRLDLVGRCAVCAV